MYLISIFLVMIDILIKRGKVVTLSNGIRKGSVIKGPVVIGKNCNIGPNTYIGPYTSIGDNTTVEGGEIESSIIMGDSKIKCNGKIVDSLIGKHSTITSSEKLPKGHRLIIGENSSISL